MNYFIYPKPLSQATNEKLTQEMQLKYWIAIKNHLQTALRFSPMVIDYKYVICINYISYDFLFRITEIIK